MGQGSWQARRGGIPANTAPVSGCRLHDLLPQRERRAQDIYVHQDGCL
jgi:hypothetical protein